MPETLFKVDLTKPMDQQEMPGHNRWHPDIPAVASVNPGDVFRIECKDWTDGQIKDNDDPQDIADVNLEVVHVLSGPIWVNGAQPGDILVVDILEVGALQGDEWGFTGIFAKENGGGFLTDHFPKAAKARNDLVENQQDAVLRAELPKALQIAHGRDDDPSGAGHGLNDDRGDRFAPVERNAPLEGIGQMAPPLGLTPGEGHVV